MVEYQSEKGKANSKKGDAGGQQKGGENPLLGALKEFGKQSKGNKKGECSFSFRFKILDYDLPSSFLIPPFVIPPFLIPSFLPYPSLSYASLPP